MGSRVRVPSGPQATTKVAFLLTGREVYPASTAMREVPSGPQATTKVAFLLTGREVYPASTAMREGPSGPQDGRSLNTLGLFLFETGREVYHWLNKNKRIPFSCLVPSIFCILTSPALLYAFFTFRSGRGASDWRRNWEAPSVVRRWLTTSVRSPRFLCQSWNRVFFAEFPFPRESRKH